VKETDRVLISRAAWSSDSRVYWPAPAHLWNGVVDGEQFGAGVTVLFYANEQVGTGPKWHVHTYDEIFILQAGRAQFTVGDRTFEANEGDVVFGPANVPHKFTNLGPGVLQTIDIHVSPRWEQTNLDDPEAPAPVNP
jgi:mannose-6-phosphate isomerase-like protein (cupin superfamily)